MRILLLGKNGQLGWELHRTLQPLGEILAYGLPDFDLTDIKQLKEIIRAAHPEVIVNATAYTNVDKAESEVELAAAINTTAPQIIAEEAHKMQAALIHFSTDYVFDGAKSTAYTEIDTPNPINTYGRTKLHGERAVQAIDGAYLLLRTSWVYSLRRASFVTKVLQWAQKNEILHIVTDQISSPTWCRFLAEITALMLARSHPDTHAWIRERKGLYHLSGDGSVSRMEFAQAVLDFAPGHYNLACKEIQPALTSDFPSAAHRPVNSTLLCEKFKETFILNIPDWRNTLQLAMSEME